MKQSKSQSDEELWKAVQQLRELQKTTPWWSRARHDESIVAVLNHLVKIGSPAALPAIARCLLTPSESVLKVGRGSVAKLLSTVSPYELIHIADSFAWSYGWYVTDEWDRLSPKQVQPLAGSLDEPGHVDVLGLLSFHRNGYVRHEAVRALTRCTTGEELRYLILRQNDWVEPIASDAAMAVTSRVHDQYAGHVLSCLPLVLHLAKMSRRDHSGFVEHAVQLLYREKHDSLLQEAINSPHREVRRLVVKIGLQGTESLRRAAVLAIESDDPNVRLMGCRHITASFSSQAAQTVLERLSRDKSMPVRREVARIRADLLPSQADEIWQDALLDRSRAIRDLAQFMLRQRGHKNIGDHYREAIGKCPDSLPALEGLAECGDESDVSLFATLLTHKWPSRRVVAIRALARIEKEGAVRYLVSMLEDHSPRVLREVRASLNPFLHAVPAEEILSSAVTSDSISARQNAAALLSDSGKWRGLSWLLKVVAESDDETSRFATHLIREWFSPPKCNRVFTNPSQPELQAIAAAFPLAENRMPPEISALLSAEIRSRV